MRRLLGSVLLFIAVTTVSALPAQAAYTGAYSGVNCREASNSAVCQGKSNKDPLTGNGGLLIKITNLISYIAGAVAVIIIIVSGIKFITASGDSNAISSARGTIIGALIGLAIIVLARSIINFVIMKL